MRVHTVFSYVKNIYFPPKLYTVCQLPKVVIYNINNIIIVLLFVMQSYVGWTIFNDKYDMKIKMN